MNQKSLPLRIYADTTVFGGIVDEEFEAASRAFFQQVRAQRFTLVTSALVRQEVQAAPQEVRALFAEVIAIAEAVDIVEEAVRLRRAYVDAGIVRPKALADALHVATATVNRCTLIVSWNFKDIVNFRKIPLYNAVNTLHGYGSIAIYSPREVIEDEDQNL
jgi:predicted nucleic acid-binding protein